MNKDFVNPFGNTGLFLIDFKASSVAECNFILTRKPALKF